MLPFIKRGRNYFEPFRLRPDQAARLGIVRAPKTDAQKALSQRAGMQMSIHGDTATPDYETPVHAIRHEQYGDPKNFTQNWTQELDKKELAEKTYWQDLLAYQKSVGNSLQAKDGRGRAVLSYAGGRPVLAVHRADPKDPRRSIKFTVSDPLAITRIVRHYVPTQRWRDLDPLTYYQVREYGTGLAGDVNFTIPVQTRDKNDKVISREYVTIPVDSTAVNDFHKSISKNRNIILRQAMLAKIRDDQKLKLMNEPKLDAAICAWLDRKGERHFSDEQREALNWLITGIQPGKSAGKSPAAAGTTGVAPATGAVAAPVVAAPAAVAPAADRVDRSAAPVQDYVQSVANTPCVSQQLQKSHRATHEFPPALQQKFQEYLQNYIKATGWRLSSADIKRLREKFYNNLIRSIEI